MKKVTIFQAFFCAKSGRAHSRKIPKKWVLAFCEMSFSSLEMSFTLLKMSFSFFWNTIWENLSKLRSKSNQKSKFDMFWVILGTFSMIFGINLSKTSKESELFYLEKLILSLVKWVLPWVKWVLPLVKWVLAFLGEMSFPQNARKKSLHNSRHRAIGAFKMKLTLKKLKVTGKDWTKKV